ncbi:MAG: RidA family protein [Crocinitomicaceae bacterium]|nr:RidA family protein [Crocinitomicaceae bacterium]
MKKALQIPGAPAPIGPYSQAILSGSTLYVSGQIPLNPSSGELVNDSIEASTTQVMENLQALLKEADMDMSNVVKCSIFLKSLDNFAAVNQIYGSYFRSTPPARETVEVSKLPMGVDVEISCIAIREN